MVTEAQLPRQLTQHDQKVIIIAETLSNGAQIGALGKPTTKEALAAYGSCGWGVAEVVDTLSTEEALQAYINSLPADQIITRR